ncbi:hypothetical protein V8E51_006311, partial [Hyaloscypha variabilis]
MGESFEYLPAWRVLVCRECGFCLRPGKGVWIRHLRQPPHCLKGTLLRAQVELLESYDLCAPEDQPQQPPCQAVPGLRLFDGFQCLACSAGLTQHLPAIERHISKAHHQKPAQQVEGSSWQKCKLQSFFAEKQYIRYFVVGDAKEAVGALDAGTKHLDSGEADFFGQLGEDAAV